MPPHGMLDAEPTSLQPLWFSSGPDEDFVGRAKKRAGLGASRASARHTLAAPASLQFANRATPGRRGSSSDIQRDRVSSPATSRYVCLDIAFADCNGGPDPSCGLRLKDNGIDLMRLRWERATPNAVNH